MECNVQFANENVQEAFEKLGGGIMKKSN